MVIQCAISLVIKQEKQKLAQAKRLEKAAAKQSSLQKAKTDNSGTAVQVCVCYMYYSITHI
jgi:hypothetical protein